jgi:dTDP-4-amino-4,6-dideoxygalactose transaminase
MVAGPPAFIDLRSQQDRVRTAIDAAIGRVLDHGRYIMGPEVAELEQRLASFTGARHALTCGSGTDALVLGLLANGVRPGDAVVVPSFTFVATAEAVALLGAVPLFADIDGSGFLLGPESLTAALRAGERRGLHVVGVIGVDVFGEPADYAALGEVIAGRELWMIADAAQSFGATDGVARVGTLAPLTATSFFPAKPLGCYGDGGAVFTDDDATFDTLVSLRNHGQGEHKYDNVRIGLNGRLDTLQAAVLLAKLTIFEDELHLRHAVAHRYIDGLDGFGVDALLLPSPRPGTRSAWAQFTIRSSDRDTLRRGLERRGVPTAIYYPTPLHHQPAYRCFPTAANTASATLVRGDAAAATVLSLPMHPYIGADEQDRIIDAVRDIVSRG